MSQKQTPHLTMNRLIRASDLGRKKLALTPGGLHRCDHSPRRGRIVVRWPVTIIIGAFCLLCAIYNAMAEAPVWGVNTMTLQTPYSDEPTLGEVLTNSAHTVSLGRFYRAGGTGVARAGTECRIAYDANSLIAVFRCSEPELSFPSTNRNADWFSLLSTP